MKDWWNNPAPGDLDKAERLLDEESAFDIINKARHYNSHPSGVEAIDVCRHLTGDWFNVFKYIFRADHKNGRQDIEKAIYYAKDGLIHGIPVQAPTWSPKQNQLMTQIIAAELENDNRRGFFHAINNNDGAWTLAEAEAILESWPE